MPREGMGKYEALLETPRSRTREPPASKANIGCHGYRLPCRFARPVVSWPPFLCGALTPAIS